MCDPKTGMPINFHVFKYGITVVQRLKARERLAIADATRAAGATEEYYKEWRDSQRKEAGY